MTGEEAKQVLLNAPLFDNTTWDEAQKIHDAIHTLTDREPCEDAISREATLKPYEALKDNDTISVWLIKQNIKQQPSVQPTRLQGEVENYQEETPNGFQRIKYICSNCGAELQGATRPHGYWKVFEHDFGNVYIQCSKCEHFYERPLPIFNFCPNCGADMRGDIDAE